ncbi:MAG: cell division protein FtsQ/DivIB [Candidatus Saccharimonadales bacterium]
MARARRRPSPEAKPQFQATYHRGKAAAKASRSVSWPAQAAAVLLLVVLGLVGWYSFITSIEVISDLDPDLEREVQVTAESRFNFQWQVSEASLEELAGKYSDSIAAFELQRQWHQRTLQLTAVEHEPSLQWQSGEEVYLLDRNGVAITRDASTELPLVRDAANLPVELGRQVVPDNFISFVQAIVDSRLDWTELRVLETTSELHVTLAAGYQIRFATQEDIAVQLDNIARVQAQAAEQGETIRQYIDVRLPYKVYWR